MKYQPFFMFDLTQNKKLLVETPQIMGVLNVTPDSFSDGGQFNSVKDSVNQAKRMIDEGADIIDVGGESTRPGAEFVSEQIELDRVIPVIKAIRQFSDIQISIDTSKAEVMRQAVESGATLINDVYALQKPNAVEVVSELNIPVCLMHMQGDPKTMQQAPKYDNILDEVIAFLRKRIFVCQQHGIDTKNLILDPGFGFGKTVEQNFLLLSQLDKFTALGFKVLVGISRKSMLGAVTGNDVENRLPESLSAAVIAALKGVNILRVHDVLETHNALTIVKQLS